MSKRNKDFRVGKNPPTKSLVVYINGYGAPAEPLKDEQLDRYLRTVFARLRDSHLDGHIRAIYACGGPTNRKDLSEAEAIRQWVAVNEPAWLDWVYLLDKTTTLRDNLVAFRDVLADDEYPVLFCEYSRRYTAAMLARHFLGLPIAVEGIKFDPKALTLTHQLKQAVVNRFVEWASLRSTWAEGLRVKARREHVAREREKMETILAAKGT